MTDPDRERVKTYHELTKHRLDRYAPGPGFMDWATQPDPFRRFAGAPRIALPLLADTLDTPFGHLRRPAGTAPRPLDLDNLAILLELSLGLSAWKVYGSTRWALRCNPSSGNLHPTEGYLVCPGMAGLPAGVHHYLSRDHLLEHRAAPDPVQWTALFPATGVLVGLSSIHWRETWKYGARAYRYCQHDAGHAIAALRYAAAALGWRAQLLEAWGDDDIARLLGLDRGEDFADAEREAPDVLLWIGLESAEPAPEVLDKALIDARWHGKANRLSARHLHHWPAIDEVDAAARKPRTPPCAPAARPALPPLQAASTALPAATLFRQRRSAVAFDGRTGIPASVFFGMLDALLPRPQVPPWDTLPWEPRVHPVFFVHRVEGLEAGLYILPRHGRAESALRTASRPDWLWQEVPGCPPHLPLRRLLSSDTRQAAQIISCHQDIAADSAFSLGMLAEFRDALGQGPWWYRFLHWEAGMLGHVLYLEAEAAGVRGTGMGCFFDDAMHELLGLGDDRFQTLYHFTVGGPVEDPRLSTLPPYAHLKSYNAKAQSSM